MEILTVSTDFWINIHARKTWYDRRKVPKKLNKAQFWLTFIEFLEYSFLHP